MSQEDPERNGISGTNEHIDRHTILEDAGITRRQFVTAAVATGGALTFGGQATADHTSEKTDELYEFIQTHTEPDYEIQTLIRLNDTAGQNDLDTFVAEWNEDTENEDIEIRHTSEPELASYAHLTTAQSREVIELNAVDSLEFSPGANPFWQLGKYDEGVFPSVDDSAHYIQYDEMIAGMEHLANEHPNRLNFFSVGRSVGHHNLLTGEVDRNGMWVAELTNDIDDEETFTEKQKVVFSFSIHGDERAGVETGCRLIESIVEGDEPGIDDALDDIVILCAFSNPDGWVVRQPQYIGVLNNFQRTNGADIDRNRSFPSAGLINPSHYPSDPYGQNLENDQPGEIDDDVPDRTLEHAAGTPPLVQWLRGYENHEAFADLHGKGPDAEFVYGLTPNSNRYNHAEQHDSQEMLRLVGEYLSDELGSIEDHGDDIAPGLVRFNLDPDDPEDREEGLPTRLYDFGTWRDTLGYTASGDFTSWIASPEEFGGLGTKSITPEMSLTNKASGIVQEHTPSLLDLQVRGDTAAMRAVVDHSVSSVDADIDTGGRDTAVIYTDALTRSSDDLVFADTEMVQTDETASIEAGGTETVTIDVSEQATQITVTIDHERSIYATLHDPDDAQIDEYDSADEHGRGAEWCVTDPVPGDWTVMIEHRDADDEDVEATVHIDTLITDDTDTADGRVLTPDPVEALGYEQREYEATPFQYFEDYDDFLDDDGSLDVVSVEDVRDGALTDDEETPAYENVVLIHDDGLDDIVNALDRFVEAGGNLVVTDTGVLALGRMNAAGATDISDNDVTVTEMEYPELDPAPQDPDADEDADELPSRDLDHPLLANTRWFNLELYTLASVGYTENEAPVVVVDPGAFEGAGGQIAARTDDEVSVGSLGAAPTETGDERGGIQVVGTLLPPPNQRNLHPFGLLDYGVEFLGHTIMTNTLGHEQQRFVDGELTELWTDQGTATPD